MTTKIADALELAYIDTDIYQSKRLWLPIGSRGVFGGQIIAQALSAATNTVDKQYIVNSLQSYFLLPGDNKVPILYRVIRVRDGKSYCTRLVNAIQNGKVILTAACSFQVPEKSELDHQYPMPKVPFPEEIKRFILHFRISDIKLIEFNRIIIISTQETLQEWAENKVIPEKYRELIRIRLEEPIPIEFKKVVYPKPEDYINPVKTEPKQCVWMKSKQTLPDDIRFHHVVAAYCSDHYLLSTALFAHGITSFSNPRLNMIASLDHVIWFHAPFRADEWLLFEMESSRTIGGRGLTFGRFFTRDGKLVMSCAQEGVIRVSPQKSISEKKRELISDPKISKL
ncbi:Acyl-CoA thioesterase 8 [Nowakowskiella sp. JEL0407]|nr:Acyl-CoA thioesterase 8 [Nowakowskiella sp. JEL0407]